MKKEWSRRELYAHGEPFGDCATQRKLGGGYICGGGGKGSAPPAPDYTAAAEKQGQSSLEAIRAQTAANRPNQYTPWGSQTWTNNKTFDQAGYDKALADYNASYKPATPGSWSYGGGGDSGGSDIYTPGTEGSYGMAMPDRSKFEGQDNWTQTTTLNPEAQRALDSQIALQGDRSELARSFMDRVRGDMSKPFDWSGLPDKGKSLEATQFDRVGTAPRLQTDLDMSANPAERMRIENALFDRMRPIHDQQQTALDAKLANMGITAGSEAYNRASQRLGDQQSRERFNALEMGGNEMQRLLNMQIAEGQFENTARQNQQGMDINTTGFNNNVSKDRFGQDMTISEYQNKLRQQAITEQMMQRQMSLNEMNALLSGQQVQMPSMPQFNGAAASQPTQYLPAAQLQGQAQLDAFNAQNQSANSFTSGLFGLGGSLGSAAMFAFSDSRLKKIIKRVGEAQGIPLYLFKYLGSNTEHIGPIAQEVQKVRPDLVKRHQNGYLMVNYKLLMEA
jgi:hypothetical protein